MGQITLEDIGLDLPPQINNIEKIEDIVSSPNNLAYDAISLHLRALQRLWPFFIKDASLEEKVAVELLLLDFIRKIRS